MEGYAARGGPVRRAEKCGKEKQCKTGHGCARVSYGEAENVRREYVQKMG